MADGHTATRFRRRTVEVRGRPVAYLVGGAGPAVVFLHGWALSASSYRAALRRLSGAGLRVLAPALPGFGGTADLPAAELDLSGVRPVGGGLPRRGGTAGAGHPGGHSFGGGVAVRTAQDAADRIGRLVLVNSIGGSIWTDDGAGTVRFLRDRPIWDWGLHLRADVLPIRQLTRVLPVIAQDVARNLLRSPGARWRVGRLASTADLRPELEELKRRRVPVVVVWGRQDQVIPEASLAAMRLALGDPRVVTVEGSHAWLIRDPRSFTEVITNVVGLGPAGDDGGPAEAPPSLG
jgi:pimeloyl-ACP methyl ester carboxylesterase